MKYFGHFALAVCTLAACAFFQKATVTGSPEQATFDQVISQGAAIGCKALPASDQVLAKTTLVTLKSAAPIDLAAAFQNPAQSPALFAIGWNLINGVLNALPTGQYAALLPMAEKAVVAGCSAALGV